MKVIISIIKCKKILMIKDLCFYELWNNYKICLEYWLYLMVS